MSFWKNYWISAGISGETLAGITETYQTRFLPGNISSSISKGICGSIIEAILESINSQRISKETAEIFFKGICGSFSGKNPGYISEVSEAILKGIYWRFSNIIFGEIIGANLARFFYNMSGRISNA